MTKKYEGISKAALRALRDMACVPEEHTDYEIEITRDGKSCYIGMRRMQVRTIEELVWLAAVRNISESNSERYVINSTGRAIARRPQLAAEIVAAMAERRPFSVGVDDRIQLSLLP